MKWLLTLVILASSAILYQQWWHWTPPTAPPPPPAATSTAPPALALTAPPVPSQESYSVVIERPLFLPDRRPPPPADIEPTDANAPAPVVPVDVTVLDSFDLSAILIIGATHSAWIRKTRGPEIVRVRHGELLEGWQVKEITADSVLLEQQGQSKRLVLRDYNKPPPLIPPTPRTVGGSHPAGKPAAGSAAVGQTPPPVKSPIPGSISGTGGANATPPAAPPRPAPPKVPSFGPG